MKNFTGYTKGINLGGWLSQCIHTKEHYNSFILENDIKIIKSWGADHIRLPMDYELFETEDGHYREEGFSYVNKAIKWCDEYGLNLILDLHKTAGYDFSDQINSSAFFENEPLQERFTALWIELSKRYGKFHERVAFELLNEVVPHNVSDKWNQIAKSTIAAIRSVAPETFILIGGVCYNSISSVKYLEMPYDNKIVYNFHFYGPMVFTHQAAHWMSDKIPSDFHISYPYDLKAYKSATAAFLPEETDLKLFDDKRLTELNTLYFELMFEEAVSIAETRGVPLYCGEYGVIKNADVTSTLNWYRDIHKVFEKYGIGRAIWTYKRKDFGITDKHYSPIFDELIKLL